ncbi:Uncharacterised protein [Pseudoalteromonas nigrifaciens]|nr:Uncharacterised protein [Pseudoalteromonas nigrifaciens]
MKALAVCIIVYLLFFTDVVSAMHLILGNYRFGLQIQVGLGLS